jgi:micrococcal nuclease
MQKAYHWRIFTPANNQTIWPLQWWIIAPAFSPMVSSLRLFGMVILVSIFYPALSIADEPTVIFGTVTHVRDGDTIVIGEVAIRLYGISAPELNEPLGEGAREFMEELVFGKQLRCELNGKKTYDRFVGICFSEQTDIGSAIIANGFALDCPRYSKGRYKNIKQIGTTPKIRLPNYCVK